VKFGQAFDDLSVSMMNKQF